MASSSSSTNPTNTETSMVYRLSYPYFKALSSGKGQEYVADTENKIGKLSAEITILIASKNALVSGFENLTQSNNNEITNAQNVSWGEAWIAHQNNAITIRSAVFAEETQKIDQKINALKAKQQKYIDNASDLNRNRGMSI